MGFLRIILASSSRGEKPDLEKEVTEIKGSRVRVHRGDLMKDRAKNNIKVLKESSKRLQIQVKKCIKEVAGVHILLYTGMCVLQKK